MADPHSPCPLDVGTLVEFHEVLIAGEVPYSVRARSGHQTIRGRIVGVEDLGDHDEWGSAGWGYTISANGQEFFRQAEDVRVVSAVEQLGELADDGGD